MSERAPGPARPRAAPNTRVSERDREILAFAAEHRFVVATQVQALLGASPAFAYRRLGGLERNGLLTRERILHDEPSWYRITATGLRLIGSELPAPRLDLRCHRHDAGLAWVWLAASRGAFGRVERLVSEREMRSRDGAASATGGEDGTFGIRVGAVGPRGRVGLHYPDLLLVGTRGERVAVELELSAKGGRRLESILTAYAADARIDAVLYLVEKPGIRREIESAAARLGIADLVHVRPVEWQAARAESGGREATRGPAARSPADRSRAAGSRAARSSATGSSAARSSAPGSSAAGSSAAGSSADRSHHPGRASPERARRARPRPAPDHGVALAR